MKNYKKQIGSIANWYLSKLGSCPPTETGRQMLTETDSKFFWQTWDFQGRNLRGTWSSQVYSLELLETKLEFVKASSCVWVGVGGGQEVG